ncbi:MAG: hypothetical protein GX890_06030 [Firmicutes bacterium]|jgi:hypothetical protein|nr:hypothetical protein [Bacillota bacterium]HPU01345.1 hypothetical protein [Bacillota bacterium]
MRGRSILLALLALLAGALMYCLVFSPQPVIAYNPDNLIMPEEAALK